MTNTKFYTFRQNNSGGSFKFDHNAGLSYYVIIEAKNAEQANELAESIGIYFDGCWRGSDCPCCGDRWRDVSEKDATDIPKIYDTPVTDFIPTYKSDCYIHYLDGRIEKNTI